VIFVSLYNQVVISCFLGKILGVSSCLPTAFVPAEALPAILRRVHRALRSAGWLLLGMVNPGVDPLAGSLARLRTALWGGALLIPTDVESMLGQAGYVDVLMLPAPPAAVAAMIAARRP